MQRSSGSILGMVLAAALAGAAWADAPEWRMETNYTLTVGQTATVYAVRAKSCDQGAPAFDDVKRRLPKTTLGTFSDGGTVQRTSMACTSLVGSNHKDAWVPARAITFTATSRGTETLKFFTDPIVLTVK
jgi:hypothetical protein